MVGFWWTTYVDLELATMGEKGTQWKLCFSTSESMISCLEFCKWIFKVVQLFNGSTCHVVVVLRGPPHWRYWYAPNNTSAQYWENMKIWIIWMFTCEHFNWTKTYYLGFSYPRCSVVSCTVSDHITTWNIEAIIGAVKLHAWWSTSMCILIFVILMRSHI